MVAAFSAALPWRHFAESVHYPVLLEKRLEILVWGSVHPIWVVVRRGQAPVLPVLPVLPEWMQLDFLERWLPRSQPARPQGLEVARG